MYERTVSFAAVAGEYESFPTSNSQYGDWWITLGADGRFTARKSPDDKGSNGTLTPITADRNLFQASFVDDRGNGFAGYGYFSDSSASATNDQLDLVMTSPTAAPWIMRMKRR